VTRTIDADVLIIGSGAGGGALAGTLTELLPGKQIVIAEKGGHYGSEFFTQREWDARVLFAEKGRRSTADGSIPVKSGECVGGGTMVNVTFCHDPLPEVWTRWRNEYGVEQFSFDRGSSDYGVPGLNVANVVDEVKKRLNIHLSTEEDVNENNRLFEQGCAKVGISSRRWERNTRDCIGCGYCNEGCAYDRKQGTDQTYVVDAVGRGAKLIHSFDITSIELAKRNGALTALGATGRVRETDAGSRPNSVAPGALHVRAKLVILAAGAIADPVLLLRSGVPDPHHVIGRGLILHPSLPVIGLMDRKIVNYRGVSGVSFSDHYAQSHGFFFESLFGHPVYGSAAIPGVGDEHFAVMQKFDHLAAFGVMLVDSVDPRNRVEVTPATARIHYQLTDGDRERLRFGAERAVELMFAAGAAEVILPSEEPVGPLPSPRFRSVAEARYARDLQFVPHRTVLTSAHCQASVKMSEDPSRGAIDSRCETHGVKNLMVCDASSFPTSCGVNPMMAILTLARYQGKRVAAEWARYA
jgi:choline dehydrogenase-like flavoprotein